MKTRIAYFDMMRGLIMLLVVVYHACCWGYSSNGQIAAVYDRVNPALANIRMPILMLISGYLIRNIGERSRQDVASRMAQLAWLYALWMPVNLIAHVATDSGALAIAELPAHLMLEWLSPTSEMWFIWSLVILTGLAYMLRDVPRHIVLVIFLLANGLTYQIGGLQGQIAVTNLPRLAIFFFGGILFHQEIRHLVSSRFSMRTFAILIAATIATHVGEDAIHEKLDVYAFQGLESMTVSLTVLYLCRILTLVRPMAQMFIVIGRNTLPIYLAHVPIILMLRGTITGDGAWLYVSPLVLAACGVGGSLLLHRLVQAVGAGWMYSKPSWLDDEHSQRAVDRIKATLHLLTMSTGR